MKKSAALTAESLHLEACQKKLKSYIDPVTQDEIFTRYYLLKRGYCCNQGCRHCPYDGIHITIRFKNPSA